MELKCPRCQTGLAISKQIQDTTIHCPQCQKRIHIRRSPAPSAKLSGQAVEPKAEQKSDRIAKPTLDRGSDPKQKLALVGQARPARPAVTDQVPPPPSGPVNSKRSESELAMVIAAMSADGEAADPTDRESRESIDSNPDSKLFALRQAALARARRRRQWSLAIGLLMAALCLGAVVYLYQNLDFAELARNLSGEPLSAGGDQDAPLGDASKQTGDSTGRDPNSSVAVAQNDLGNNKPTAAPQPPPLPPIQHPPYRLLTLKQMESVWDTVRPYTARLLVHRGSTVTPVAATVIDARGWVLSSRSAIAEATRLEIQMAPRSALEESDDSAPRDDVRGVLAESIELDLVVLQVNRDLFSILRPLSFDVRPLVAERVLVQVCPVDASRWSWFQETTLRAGGEFDQLTATDQQQLLQSAIAWNLDRVTNPRVTSSSAGAALFTPTGELVGINTGCELSRGRVVIEARDLERWLTSWSSKNIQATPLALKKAETPANSPADGPLDEMSRSWRDRLQPWRDSQWNVTSQDQFGDLQELVADMQESLGKLKEQEEKSPADVACETLLLDAQRDLFQSWTKLDETQRRQRNDWAQEQMRGGTGLFCVQVHIPVVSSPEIQNHPTVTLRIEGTKQYLIAKTNPDERLLIRSSRWLIWGQREIGKPLQMMDELGETLQPDRFEVLSWLGEIR